ncbi:hypothetical protein PROFUN_15464 [Planoprotostelium fungivorum]|uniref:Uncharacterized protein n=1 Tax=Planoprotostelium fungivorum TaxID=1890364 RepID=A0A2P6MW14_9EUKA|nr:hypothetical protein PROFUN_15464 [Planoprotostelium fungivorum]
MTNQREEIVSFDDDTIALVASWFSLEDIRSTLSQVDRQWRRITRISSIQMTRSILRSNGAGRVDYGLEREDAPDQGPLFRTLNNHWMKSKISEAIFKMIIIAMRNWSDDQKREAIRILRDRIHLTHMQPSPCGKLLRIIRRDGSATEASQVRTPLRLFGMNTRGIEEIDERLISELDGKHLKPSQVRWILTEIVLLEEPIHNYRNYFDQQRRVLSLLRILDQHMNTTDVKYSFSWPHSES